MTELVKLYFKDPETEAVSVQYLHPVDVKHALAFKDQWSREPWPEKVTVPPPPPPPPKPATKSK